MKDDNILVRRKEDFEIEISLCDFGMAGKLDQPISLSDYVKCSNFRCPSLFDNDLPLERRRLNSNSNERNIEKNND